MSLTSRLQANTAAICNTRVKHITGLKASITVRNILFRQQSGDLQHQGKTYHRIESIDNSKKYLIPATKQGVPERLLLNDVIYDGNSIMKAPEKTPVVAKTKSIEKSWER